MNQSGKLLELSTDIDCHIPNLVRFYYGETTGERFKAMAFDDYEAIEADLHEEKLQQENVDYLRIDFS
jgi:hypothetical protein